MVTIKEIAERLGISVSTVSKGLNGANDISEATKQMVLDAAVEMGYSTKRMRRQEMKKICVLIENMDYESIDQFGYDMVMGFKKTAARKHWDVKVMSANLNLQMEERYDTFMLRNGFCGAFLIGFTLHEDWLHELHDTSVPTVLLDNYIKNNPRIGYVGTDSFEGIEQAVSHLAALGHRKIAFLNGSKNSMVSRQRQIAFVQSMNRCGLKCEENLMEYGYYVPDCAKDHVAKFLSHGATAIMCASDLIATGAVAEVRKFGLRVPEDVSVVGFDDLPIATAMEPPLTTIRQDRTDLGKSAVLLLDGLMSGVSISKILLRAKFILRSSTDECRR